jgi:short-subunit dehydrogenase
MKSPIAVLPPTTGTKTAVITGASSGIGAAFARRLARDGFSLVLQGRRRELLESLCAGLESAHGIKAEYVTAELSDPQELLALEKKVAEIPDLEILVNNAGFGLVREFHRESVEEQERMIRVHLIATIRLTHAAISGMLRRGHGSIINVSSVAGYLVAPRSNVYAATKAFLNSFSESLHVELHGKGIRIQALCPGYTKTDFHPRLGLSTSRRVIFSFMPPERVVDASLRALSRHTVICVPGVGYKFAAVAGRLAPRHMMYWLANIARKTSLAKSQAAEESN